MATPNPPYLTQQWSGHTHYICPLCGYNTFNVLALEGHRCLPAAAPDVGTAAAAQPAEAQPDETAAPTESTEMPPPSAEQEGT